MAVAGFAGKLASAEVWRHRQLSPYWRGLLCVSAGSTVLLAINQILNLHFFVDVVLIDNRYYLLTLALLFPFVFILFPIRRKGPYDRVPWYDIVLALIAFSILLSLSWFAERAEAEAWEFAAPTGIMVMCYILWALLLDGARRAGGLAIFCVVLLVSLYPIFADKMPMPFTGLAFTFSRSATYHIISSESLLGIPTRAFANIVLGFIVFGAALQHSGAGKFFMDFAFALLGHVRGGPAKVAIFSSGLLGSLSGSVTTNVLTTGTLTIPAMKRMGFSASYAAGVEACASTGGVLMPPIMGATAFVMAAFLNVPYLDVAVAAIIPSLLYFFGLFVAIDAYSARRGLKGMPRAELPNLAVAIKEGWQYIFVFAFLIYMLAIEQQEILAPYYSTVLLIVINQIMPHTRWRLVDFMRFVDGAGRLFIELVGVLAAVGLVVGALTMTGTAASFTNDLMLLSGNNPYVLLVAGAAICFVLGIGLTVTAAYIFLAVVFAPGMIASGFDPLAIHLFLLYWGMLSFITPPVAIGAFAAAALAEADGMKTGFQAMRLGAILYFIPFFFVLNPAMIFHGSWTSVILVTVTAFVGVVFIAAALQGYLLGVGPLTGGLLVVPTRALLLIGGLLFAMPGGGRLGYSNIEFAMMALVVSGLGILAAFLLNRGRSARIAAKG